MRDWTSLGSRIGTATIARLRMGSIVHVDAKMEHDVAASLSGDGSATCSGLEGWEPWAWCRSGCKETVGIQCHVQSVCSELELLEIAITSNSYVAWRKRPITEGDGCNGKPEQTNISQFPLLHDHCAPSDYLVTHYRTSSKQRLCNVHA